MQARAVGGEQRLGVDQRRLGGGGRPRRRGDQTVGGRLAFALQRFGRMRAGRDKLDDRIGRLGDARDRADEMHAAVRQARPQRQRDVDAGLGQLAVEGERVVEQHVAFRADAQGRREAGEVDGQRAQLARPLFGRQMRRVEVPEPAHLRFRQAEAAVAIEPVRGEVHLRRVGAVDRNEAGDPGPVLVGEAGDRHRREIGAGRIAGDEHRAARPRQRVGEQGADLVLRGGERMLGGQRVVELDDAQAELGGEPARDVIVAVDAADRPAAAMDEDQRRALVVGIVVASRNPAVGRREGAVAGRHVRALAAARRQNRIFVDPQPRQREIERAVLEVALLRRHRVHLVRQICGDDAVGAPNRLSIDQKSHFIPESGCVFGSCAALSRQGESFALTMSDK